MLQPGNIVPLLSEIDCRPMGRRVGSRTRELEQAPGTGAQRLRERLGAPVCGGNMIIHLAIVNMEKGNSIGLLTLVRFFASFPFLF